MIIEKILPRVQKNVWLKDYTTFKIGGRAKYFLEVKTREDLTLAIKTAKKFKLPFFILGRGSNLLVADKGYNGLVIKIQNSLKESLRLPTGQAKFKTIYVESGVRLSDLIKLSLEKSLTGLEWAAGIPGTVGGAVYGNAGAFRKSIGNVVEEVEVFDVKKEKSKIFKNKDCQFNYRDSIFKHKKNLIILSAKLQFKKEKKSKIERKIKECLSYRKETQPLNFPSAGSIFKNRKSKIENRKLLKKFPQLKAFNKRGLIPIAWLIEKCGLKGKKIGNVKISEKHANFIINLRDGKAKEVIKLINLAKKKVKNKFKVKLEEEIQYLPPKF